MKELLVSYLQADSTGCSYYRLVQLRNELNNNGFIKCYDTPLNYSPLSDIVIWQRYDALELLYNMDKRKINVYELDDNIWDMPDYLDVEGSKTKQFYIDRKDNIKDFMNECDFVTTTTDYLANEISKNTGFPRDKMYTIPNYINFKKIFYGKRSHDDVVRIAWTMDTRRKDFDIKPALKALKRILDEYKGKVQMLFFGDCPKSFIDEKKRRYHDNIYVVPFNKNIEEYYRTLVYTPIDIGICPAQDTVFNNCKSNLKVLEFGAIGAAVVASPIHPYIGMPHVKIAHNEDEWYNYLKEYIDSKCIRTEDGLELHEHVKTNYSLLEVGLEKHLEIFDDMLDKKPRKSWTIRDSLNNMHKKIVYCVSSKSRSNLAPIKRNVATWSELYNVEVVLSENPGTFAMHDVYNGFVTNEKDADYFIFAHDDIEIFDQDWLHKVMDGLKEYDIVGLAGSNHYDPMHGMWSPMMTPVFSSGCVAHKDGEKYIFTNYGLGKEVITADGLLLAMKANVAQNVKWKSFNKFHFYDIAFCIDARKAGYKIGIIPMGIKHNSTGSYDEGWFKGLCEFRKEYGSNIRSLHNRVSGINVYLPEDDYIAYSKMVTSLERQSVKVNYKPYKGKTEMPYLVLDRSVIFHIPAFEMLDNLVQMNKFGKINFNIKDRQYSVCIDDKNDREYDIHSTLGIDYYEGYSYVGKY